MLGLDNGFVPSFVRQYAQLGQAVTDAARTYVADVREGRFPVSPATLADLPGSRR
jgi:3-methyl-2-oxobutanoate hydroxymethyltransferase